MTTNIDTSDVCCAALEWSKTSRACAFADPGGQTIGRLPCLFSLRLTLRLRRSASLRVLMRSV